MVDFNWELLKQRKLKDVCNLVGIHFIVFLLAATIVDLVPFVVSKSNYLSATHIGPEDNFMVDGTSFVWAVLCPFFIFCGLSSIHVRHRLISGLRDSHLLILCGLPSIIFCCIRVVLDPFSFQAISEIYLPILHLSSLWIWFVAFRPYFKFKIFYNYLMVCLLLVVSVQILSALALIPGSSFETLRNTSLPSADAENQVEIKGPTLVGLTPSRYYLRAFLEDGYIPLVKEEPGSPYSEVNLYQHPWLYVIDQNLHNKNVPFRGMAESAFLLCFATWVGCIHFWRHLSWLFWAIYPWCVLSAILSSSRTGIWGSFIVLSFTLLATVWEKKRVLALGMVAAFSTIGAVFVWFYPSVKTVHVVPSQALDYFNFFEISVSAGSNLLTIFDYSFYFRIEEFKNFLSERSFQEILFGSSVAPQFSHSFALKAATVFGLVGFALLMLPLTMIFLIGMIRFNSVHVLTAGGVMFINLVMFDVPAPWLAAFPMLLVMLQKREDTFEHN